MKTQPSAETPALVASTDLSASSWSDYFMENWMHPANGFHIHLSENLELSSPKFAVVFIVCWVAYVIWYKKKHNKTLREIFSSTQSQSWANPDTILPSQSWDDTYTVTHYTNPATGLSMLGGVDSAGNPYGSSN